VQEAMDLTNKQLHTKSLFNNVQIGRSVCLYTFLLCVVFNFSCTTPGQNYPKPHTANPALEKAKTVFNTNPSERTIAHFDSVFASLPSPGTFDLWTKYDVKANYYFFFKVMYPMAMQCADSMLTVLKGNEKEFGVEYAHTLMVKGNFLMAENRFEEALQSYYDGSLFAQNNLDPCSSAQFNKQLGAELYQQRNYLKGVLYLKKAMDELSNCSGDIAMGQEATLNTIALCFEKANMPDSAIYYYKKGLIYIDQKFPKGVLADINRGIVYGNLGGTYGVIKNYTLAQQYLKASIKINNRAGYAPEDAKTAQLKLADLYTNYAHFKEADSLLRQIDAEWRAGKGKGFIDDTIRFRWKRLLWKYYDRTHDTQKAYDFAKNFYLFRDSLNETRKGLESANIDGGLRETEQHYNLDLLSKSNQLKTTYLSAILVFSILILIILGMAWYNLKRSRKNARKLTSLNKVISDYNLQMQNALTALEQSYEENANIMKIVAHDLRAPIGGITIAVSKMLEKFSWSDNDRSTLRLIQNSGKDSLALVSDLLTTHSRSKEIKKEPVDMHLLLVYCVSFMRLKAEEKGQRIELDAGYFTVFVNRGNIWRVVCNLIANAIKFSPSGTTIKVLMLKKEDNVLITVDDCGIGIPDNMHDKIFDMFTKAKRQGTTGEQPFGIGLAISKQIIEMHGGKIWFEGKPVNGTLFHVELPIQYLS
jgi:signal transduction histidine kinase